MLCRWLPLTGCWIMRLQAIFVASAEPRRKCTFKSLNALLESYKTRTVLVSSSQVECISDASVCSCLIVHSPNPRLPPEVIVRRLQQSYSVQEWEMNFLDNIKFLPCTCRLRCNFSMFRKRSQAQACSWARGLTRLGTSS